MTDPPSLGLRRQHAAATCARLLLSHPGPGPFEAVANQLLEACDIDAVFIDRNVEDPTRCLSMSSVVLVEAPASHRQTGLLVDIPWSEETTLRDALQAGEPTATPRLRGTTWKRLDDPNGSELYAPITADNEWLGVLGVRNRHSNESWNHEDVHLLETVAAMIAANWRAEIQRARLETQLSEAQRRLALEGALARSAEALLDEGEPFAVRTLIAELSAATGADYSVLAELADVDDVRHLRYIAASDVGAAGSETERYWAPIPAAAFPTAMPLLDAGEPYILTPDILTEPERAMFDAAPVPLASTFNLPVKTFGQVAGVLSLASSDPEHTWDQPTRLLLVASARLIGFHWERMTRSEILKDLVASKDEFIASVSHELRTPLTAVVGLAHELRDGFDTFDSTDLAEFLDLMVTQSDEVAHIVEDLLVVARAEMGGLEVTRGTVGLATQVREVLEGLRVDDTAWSIDIDPALRVEADAKRLRQVIRNLASNSLRYGGSRVHMVASATPETVILEMRDDGPGIPESLHDRIFEPYERAHQSGSQTESVGLGLTVSRTLARLMDGDIEYERRDDWSVFRLTLKRDRAAEPASVDS